MKKINQDNEEIEIDDLPNDNTTKYIVNGIKTKKLAFGNGTLSQGDEFPFDSTNEEHLDLLAREVIIKI